MITDDKLTQRLTRAAAPIRGVAVPPEIVAQLVSETAKKARSRPLRKGVALGIGGAALVVGGLVAAPAAADVWRFLTQTDWTSEGTEVIEYSEWIDTSASDLAEYIEWIYPEWLPLAPGQSKASVIEIARSQHAANPGLTQEVGVRRSLERLAYMGWIDEWIDAHAAGDTLRQFSALAVLKDAATWPAFVATDGGGITYIMAGFATEIEAGNFEAAQELAQMEGTALWDGVDRLNTPGSIADTYFREYLENQ